MWFSLGILGGLSANVGLMQLNNMYKGCANVCTLCQFLFGLSQTLLSPGKRRLLFDASARRIPLGFHLIFAGMFFLGPFLGNKSTAITNADFYPSSGGAPVAPSRRCSWAGSSPARSTTSSRCSALRPSPWAPWRRPTAATWRTAGRHPAAELAAAAAAPKAAAAGASGVVESAPASEVTSVPMFIVGCGLLLANLLVDRATACCRRTSSHR